MAKRIKISEARAKLPQLAQYLRRRPGEVVVIEHRDLDEQLVLTTESYLRYLRTTIRELQKNGAKTFTLAGSITTVLSDEELEMTLREDRSRQTERSKRKLRQVRS